MFWVGGTLREETFWFLVSAISSAMERPSLLSPLNGDEKRLTTVPQRTVSLLCETDAKQASVQLLKRQALGVWHADALSDVENAIGDLHFWPTTWSKDPRSRDYDMQRLGRSKRLDNRERFELFRFVVGNGASPALAVELLAASESLPDTFAITQMENLVKKAAEGSFSIRHTSWRTASGPRSFACQSRSLCLLESTAHTKTLARCLHGRRSANRPACWCPMEAAIA